MVLSVSATFAADEDVALGEVKDEIEVDDNVLSVEEDSDTLNVTDEPAVEADDNSDVVGSSSTVTDATFHDYFDDAGTLLDNVTDDELVFEGDFTGIDVNYVYIQKSIKLTGNDATFNGVSFVIDADDVVLDGFKLYMDDDTSLISLGYVTNVTISNNVLEYKALEGYDSYAIFAYNVNLLKIINNNITYVGNTNGTFTNNVIYVEGDSNSKKASKAIIVDGNNFNITIPSVEVDYTTAPYTTFSEGIVFFFCEDINFTNNIVNMKYNTFELGKYGADSIYAVSVKSDENVYALDWDDDDNPVFTYPITSKNVRIAGNEFNVLGHDYAYGIALAADTFVIENNKFNISSDTYYANAITLNNLAANGEVTNNNISVNAPGAVYGIYSYQNGYPITDITYENNIIDAEGYLACGFELSEANSVVSTNTITTNGNYTYGMVLTFGGSSTRGSVKNNTINNLGSNIGNQSTNDPLAPKENSMAITVKSNTDYVDVTITDNKIFSTNIGINVVEDSEKVILENNIIDVTANSGKVNNYAISADSTDVAILNNNVTYYGLVDYQFVIIGYDSYDWPIYDTSNNTNAYGVYVKDSDVVIDGNNFDIAVPTFSVNWGATRESFSEGIVLVGCDDLRFTNNVVSVHTNGGSSWDTVYGIDIINSADSTIANNNITLESIGYLYAIIINDDIFNIAGNNITVTSDNYACGIDVEGPAGGIINGNTITTKATESAYPIYTGMTSGDVNVDIIGNNIEGNAYYVVGIEIAAKEALIANNNVDVDGNHTIGVGTKVSEVTIKGNAINAFASNEGDKYVWDGMKTANCGVKVIEGNATIYNNTIASNAIGINADSTNDEVTIEKNYIVVTANSGKVDNYAIFADEINDLIINNNTVIYYGLVDYQFVIIGYDSYGWPIYDSSNNTHAYGVFVKNSNAVIKNNDFDMAIPTFSINWGTGEVFSEGIVLVGCDDLVFSDNDLSVDVNGGSSWDSMYGIQILNSENAAVKNNNISLDGDGYCYALVINDNFNVSGNDICVNSYKYACGIDIEGIAEGVISNNNISAFSPTTDDSASAYPIYAGMNYMPVAVNITGNNIEGEAYYVVGLELGGTDALIEDNNVLINANYALGVASEVSNLTVNNNNITVIASNEGSTENIMDYMGSNSTGIKVKSGDSVTISNNDVKTTGDYAVDLGNNNATVTNNYLTSDKGAGEETISGTGDINSSGNPSTQNPYLKTILFGVDLTKVYGSADQYAVKVLDENGNPVVNKFITISIDGQHYTNTTDNNGIAVFDIDLTKGEYTVKASFAGDETYGFKSTSNTITVTPKPSAFTASDKSLLVTATKSGVNYIIVLKDNSGNILASKSVTITFNGKTSTVSTNSKGEITYKIVATKAGTYKLSVKFAGDDKYASSSKTATIKVSKEATKLTAAKKTYKVKVKTKKYTVTLKNSKGKAIKGLKVTLKVKGKTYKATTNAKGKATFKIKNLKKKGTYTAKVNFAGNNLYNKVSKSVKITVKK